MSVPRKGIIIFGSTGSIGRNCLEVAARFPDRFRIAGISGCSNLKLLAEQARRFDILLVAVGTDKTGELKNMLDSRVRLFAGEDGLLEMLEYPDGIDLVVNGLVGATGLKPTLRTLEKGIDLALANKESLVMAGRMVFDIAGRTGAKLIPIDSEHSAIFQCLLGEERSTVAELILTASGGPFFKTPIEELRAVTPERAMRHPNWSMGARITIDSATMLNKGLEVIEAHWLFNIPQEHIDVVIHPQSIVHSMVRFKDGSYIAQMGAPDMRLPIQFALTYPERLDSPYCRLDFSKLLKLEFHPAPMDKFPCLGLAYGALEQGGVAPVVLNAADEQAVSAFIDRRIGFMDIPSVIERTLEKLSGSEYPDLEEIMAVDREARSVAEEFINSGG